VCSLFDDPHLMFRHETPTRMLMQVHETDTKLSHELQKLSRLASFSFRICASLIMG
jgi:hypothetical protein